MKTVIALALSSLIAARLDAQCTNTLVPFGALPGVSYVVNAVANWDPDGPGPLPPRVVVGGPFGAAGGVAALAVAAWDPPTGQWSAIGGGPPGFASVNALLALPNGDLVVGGSSSFSGPAMSTLARWDGTAWTSFGGLNPSGQGVAALARLPNGDLAVGGHFTSAGAMTLPHVGTWNGTSWSSLGGGMNGPVLGLVVMPNGDLVALGEFTVAGGVPANGIARWNGIAWSALGTGLTGNVTSRGPRGETALVLPNGDLVVGGSFAQAGGVPAQSLARWDGTSWSAIGGGVTGNPYTAIEVRGLALLANGDLVVGGYFSAAGGVPIPNIARWDGTAWSPLGAGIPAGSVNALAVQANGDLIAGGAFSVAGNVGAPYVARWNGTAWSSLGNGTAPSNDVRSLLALPDGSVVAGGLFQAAGGVAAHGIARWDGSAWSAFGSGVSPFSVVHAMARLPNGDLVAGGPGFVRSWNGTAWTSLASTMSAMSPNFHGVKAIAVLDNGDLVVGGDFASIDSQQIMGLARWNGSTWSRLGGQDAGGIHAMTRLDNGDLVVGGAWWLPHPQASGIARWNGTTWLPVGTGLGASAEVFALAPLPNGGFIAAGTFSLAGGLPANNIARWNGTTWSPLGAGTNGRVQTVHVLPNGDILAAGYFTHAGGAPAPGLARWNGSVWSAIGGVVPTGHSTPVLAMAEGPGGDLLLGGGFDTAGGQISPNLVRLATTCPATVFQTGTGCGGATLRAGLPWTGSTWRADASGLPNSAAVFAVTGLATNSLLLSTVIPTALPGCTLHVQPDFVQLTLTTNGTASLQLVLPNSPVFAGVAFHHQMVPFATATSVVTATNALRMTVGSF